MLDVRTKNFNVISAFSGLSLKDYQLIATELEQLFQQHQIGAIAGCTINRIIRKTDWLAGRAARHHERWQRDQRVIKTGLTILEKTIPEFSEPP